MPMCTTGRVDPTADSTFTAIAEVRRFEGLRERIGFAVANRLVEEVAARIQACVPDCSLGRVGRTSVEFAFAAPAMDAASVILERLVSELERSIEVGGSAFDLSFTIGAALTHPGSFGEANIDRAAAALNRARDGWKKVVIARDDEQQDAGVSELSLMRDLRQALVSDGLAMHYQPKLGCRTDRVDSAEALLRWYHDEFGLIRTDRLIDMAEATGSIRQLTHWTIDRALADRRRLAEAGRPITIYVNISGVLLPDPGFADWVVERLAGAGGAIGFEITETAMIEDPERAIEHLQRFASIGIKIAIDDYGSGLSSLAYLKQLPAHELKIDRMFISGLTESHRDPLLVRSSIDLAHALEMEVTAEGVDDPMSLSLLRVMGCDRVQGYLVSHPLPIEALERYLTNDEHLAGSGDRGPTLHGWSVADTTAAGPVAARLASDR